jgi:hypothetical protein
MMGALMACLVLFMAGPVVAGDYHTTSTLFCNDCHIMHGTQQHTYAANGTSGFYTAIGSAGPYDYLLRNEPNALCLTCHDGSTFAPDVLEDNTGSNVRNAGALNESGAAPYYKSTGHTLDSTDVAPGGTWSNATGLECVDCHGPHGGAGQYRNLSPRAGGSATVPTYAIGTNDPNMDVYEIASGGATHYDISNINYNMPNATASGMGKWCSACHTNFYGTVGGTQVGGTGSPASAFHRHPSAGAIIGSGTGGHSKKEIFAWGQRSGGPVPKLNWVKVMTATGNWTPNDPTAAGWDYSPSCFSCHKSHGNQNAFGLIYMNPLAGTQTEEGTNPGTYRNLCNQCHSEGL